jgi:hypothetical protein
MQYGFLTLPTQAQVGSPKSNSVTEKIPVIAGGGVVWVYGGIYFRTVGFLDGNLNLGSTWSSNNQNLDNPGAFILTRFPMRIRASHTSAKATARGHITSFMNIA